MRFIVFIKQVPDTSIAITDDDGNLVRSAMLPILNPYCEKALTSILSIRGEEDTVTVVTMGPMQAESALRRCISLGADEAFLLSDKDFSGADTWATARVLSAFVSKFGTDSDLLVFGRQAIDGDTGQVPAEVAAQLGTQQFSYVSDIRVDGDGFIVTQDYGTFQRTAKVPMGSVVSMGSVEPNGPLPDIAGYICGRSKDIKILNRIDLGLGLYSVGSKGSLTRIVHVESSVPVRKGMMVEITDPRNAADMIIREMEAFR